MSVLFIRQRAKSVCTRGTSDSIGCMSSVKISLLTGVYVEFSHMIFNLSGDYVIII